MFVKRRLFQDKQTNNNIQTCHQTTPSSPKRHHCRSHVNEIYYYYYYYYYYSYSLTVHYIKKQNVHTVVYLLKLLDWDHLKLTHQASLILIFEKKKETERWKSLHYWITTKQFQLQILAFKGPTVDNGMGADATFDIVLKSRDRPPEPPQKIQIT